MFSDMFVKLWQQNLFLLGVWQTIYLTVISTVFAYVLGLPLGLLLCVSDKDGIHPMPVLNKILSILINAFRSVPSFLWWPCCRWQSSSSAHHSATRP